MLIKKLENVFFQENTHLIEVLDKNRGIWNGNKERGYGIAVLSHNALRFGIPLRSHIRHNFCFYTTRDKTKGLDYSKSVLLHKDEYISDNPFMIPSDEYKAIKEKTYYIEAMFIKYVTRYIESVRKNDQNVLRLYYYSTLKNYHVELGI